jgi:hypothetical protein
MDAAYELWAISLGQRGHGVLPSPIAFAACDRQRVRPGHDVGERARTGSPDPPFRQFRGHAAFNADQVSRVSNDAAVSRAPARHDCPTAGPDVDLPYAIQ